MTTVNEKPVFLFFKDAIPDHVAYVHGLVTAGLAPCNRRFRGGAEYGLRIIDLDKRKFPSFNDVESITLIYGDEYKDFL